MTIPNDLRQAPAWSEYLKMYDWKTIELPQGQALRISKFLLFSRAQLLRPSALNKETLKTVDEICKRHNVLFLKVSPSHDQDTNLLKDFNYHESRRIELPPSTMFIDLTLSKKELWNNLTSKGRYSINKSVRDEDFIEFSRNPDTKEIIYFQKLCHDRGVRKRFYVQPLTAHIEKVKAFNENAHLAKVFNREGKLIGIKLFFTFNKGVWGVHSTTTELGQKSCGGYKLLWESFEYFKNLGYEIMDLDGVTDTRFARESKRWEAYSFYKEQFNGHIVSFPLPHYKYYNVLSRG